MLYTAFVLVSFNTIARFCRTRYLPKHSDYTLPALKDSLIHIHVSEAKANTTMVHRETVSTRPHPRANTTSTTTSTPQRKNLWRIFRPRLSPTTAKKIAWLVLIFGCWILLLVIAAVIFHATDVHDVGLMVLWIGLITACKGFLAIWVAFFAARGQHNPESEGGSNYPASIMSGETVVVDKEVV